MIPDRSFGGRAGQSCLLVLGSVRGRSVYIQVVGAGDSIRFAMQESKVILSRTLQESILILFNIQFLASDSH